tara:strand:- start:3013 stop:3486 length:474 start_codon:yes stop_codon:yes gene_type:complete
MDIKHLKILDSTAIWEINQDGLPGTGIVNVKEIEQLLGFSQISLGAFFEGKLVGFVICLPPGTGYSSPNYRWFNEKYENFLYVDRIAVAKEYQNREIGSRLYSEIIRIANNKSIPVTAEVNLQPPNPGSIRFHERHGFARVGELKSGKKHVVMMLRK